VYALRPLTREECLVVEQHAWQVEKAVGKWTRLFRDADEADIQSWAHLGLIKAVQAFDPTRGASLKTCVHDHIDWAIRKGRHIQRGMLRTYWMTEVPLDAGPRFQTSNDEVDPWTISGGRVFVGYDDQRLSDVDSSSERDTLIGLLTENQRRVVELLEQDLNCAEVGRVLGISRERVGQIRLAARGVLAKHLAMAA